MSVSTSKDMYNWLPVPKPRRCDFFFHESSSRDWSSNKPTQRGKHYQVYLVSLSQRRIARGGGGSEKNPAPPPPPISLIFRFKNKKFSSNWNTGKNLSPCIRNVIFGPISLVWGFFLSKFSNFDHTGCNIFLPVSYIQHNNIFHWKQYNPSTWTWTMGTCSYPVWGPKLR